VRNIAPAEDLVTSALNPDRDPAGIRYVVPHDAELAGPIRHHHIGRLTVSSKGIRPQPPVQDLFVAAELLKSRARTNRTSGATKSQESAIAGPEDSHRKILVVDGRIGFTGGMNLCEGNQLALFLRPAMDMHYTIEGPAVALLQEVFADDWMFCTGEFLQGERWFPELEARGPVLARGITSSPDANFEKLRMIYLGALACARTSARIVTPYFLTGQRAHCGAEHCRPAWGPGRYPSARTERPPPRSVGVDRTVAGGPGTGVQGLAHAPAV
jgi:Phospholipase D Active site motif